MRNFDLSPLTRSTIGFDRMMQLFENATHLVNEGGLAYPPYNVEKLDDDAYRITMAVAGFGLDDLTITQQANSLIVAGRRQPEREAQYLHRGLAGRAFEPRFDLADFIKVTGASLDNGLLAIDLVREVPEAMKPRSIAISTQSGATQPGSRKAVAESKGKAA
jgi:molecular chaperone IbpA